MAETAWGETGAFGRLLDATVAARCAYFRTLGEPDANAWHTLVNPVLRAEPAWPVRPGWQRVRADGRTIIASSGLTDPFADDRPNVGFGVEVAVATEDELPAALGPCWLLELVQELSFQAARDARFHLRHAKFGTFLMGVHNALEASREWSDETGTMGFLVGLPTPLVPATIPLPAGSAELLVAKLLTPAEYAYVAANGLAGAKRLVERFTKDGTHHLSSLERASAV